MKNTYIAVGVLIVLGLLIWAFMPKQSRAPESNVPKAEENKVNQVQNTNQNTNTGTTQTPSKPVTPKPGTNLVTNLFPQKGSYECRYDLVSQSSRSSNVIYIAGGKMRGEFRTTDSQGFSNSNIMVYDGTYLYNWVEGKSTGVRTQPKSLKDIPVAVPTDIHEGRVLGSGIENVSWDCHAWSTVSSMLAKPTYVNF